MAAKQYPKKSPESQDSIHYKNLLRAASESAGFLGKMYWRGEGVAVNENIARQWFERGASQDNPASTTYLGKMHLEGAGGLEKSEEKYEEYLERASSLGHAYGKILLAERLLQRGKSILKVEWKNWNQIFALVDDASSKGYILGYYHLGKLYSKESPGVVNNCKKAILYTKMFVEKAHFHDTDLSYALDDLKMKRSYSLLMRYLMASERGYLLMQVNSAYMLDFQGVALYQDYNRYEQALALYLRSANQGHVDSRVRAGDLYFYGLGVSKPGVENTVPSSPIVTISNAITKYMYPGEKLNPDYDSALKHYSMAAEGEFAQSSIAMYNLGYIYEYGFGVERDYNLAKRWYDRSLSTNPGAFLPVQITSFLLHLKWVFDDFFKGLVSLYETGVYQNDVHIEEFPIPDEAIEPKEESSGNLQILITALLFFVVLIVYRRQLAAEIHLQPRATVEEVAPLLDSQQANDILPLETQGQSSRVENEEKTTADELGNVSNSAAMPVNTPNLFHADDDQQQSQNSDTLQDNENLETTANDEMEESNGSLFIEKI